jgi:hypothetical protein
MQAITIDDVFEKVTGIYDSVGDWHPEFNLPTEGCANL